MSNKKVLIVFNPRAGKNSSRDTYDNIIRDFRDFGFTVTEKTTTCVGDATEIVKHHAAKHDLICCCGGDGTFNEAVNGLIAAGADTPVLYYPMGSTNDLANTIGATKDLQKQIALYFDGQIVGYDIGQLNDRHFTYVAAFGTGTDVSFKTSQKLKNMFGHFAYMLDAFVLHFPQQVKNIQPHHMVLEYDGNRIEDDFYVGAILNTHEFSGIFKLDKENVKLNDGIFDVLLVRNVNGLGNAFQMLFKLIRQEYDDRQVLMFRTSELKITCSEPLSWTIDGEFGGVHTNIDFRVLNERVHLVAPVGSFFLNAPKPPENTDVFFEERTLKS